jgi:hypothetical protein
MKIRPVGAELYHADGQTDMSKLIVSFRNFATTLKKGIYVKPTNFKSFSVNEVASN